MIPNLTAIIIIITAAPTLILITFLPALIELKKPKDSGPRLIATRISDRNLAITSFISLADIENGQKFDGTLIDTMAKLFAFLPNLEV
jgi:hypothetical protein